MSGYQDYDRASYGDTGAGLDSTAGLGTGYDDSGGADAYESRGRGADYGSPSYGNLPHDLGGSAGVGYDDLAGGMSHLGLGGAGSPFRDDYGAAGASFDDIGSGAFDNGLGHAQQGSFGGDAYGHDALGNHARFADLASDALGGSSLHSNALPGAFGDNELRGSLDPYGTQDSSLDPYPHQEGLDSFGQRGVYDDAGYQAGFEGSGALGVPSLGFDDQYRDRHGGNDLLSGSFDDRAFGGRGSLDSSRYGDENLGGLGQSSLSRDPFNQSSSAYGEPFSQSSLSGDPLGSSYPARGASLDDQYGRSAFSDGLGAPDVSYGSAPQTSSYFGNGPYRDPSFNNVDYSAGRDYYPADSGLLANERADRNVDAGIVPSGIGAFDYKENAAGFSNPFETGLYTPATSFGDYAIGAQKDALAGQYGDLLAYQETLDANADLNEQQRLDRWNQRAEFEALDEQARQRRWNDMDILEREQLGLMGGYHGARFGGPDYYLRSVNTGFGEDPSNFGSYYPLIGSLNNRYGSLLDRSYNDRADYFDSNYLYANDLGTFSRQLRFDESLAENERLRRWQERQQFELLNEAEQARRWQEMDEQRRMQLGLGSSGFAGYRFAQPSLWSNLIDPRRLRPRHYELSNRLRDRYRPWTQRNWITDYSQLPFNEREQALAYYDLVRFDNQLQRSQFNERERLRRWQQRLAFDELNEAQRRAAWWRMRDAERAALGLGMGSLFGERYRRMGMGYGSRLFDPRRSNYGLRYQLPTQLRSQFQPFLGASFRPQQAFSQDLMALRYRQRDALNRVVAANGSLAAISRQEAANKKLLDSLDKQRALAQGNILSARTWRA